MLIGMAVWDTVANGRTKMTEATLRSLAQTVDFDRHRLIVSDNGSCQATLDLYEKMRDVLSFTLLLNGENLGTAAAVNLAWRQRKSGEHCVKMDNDVVFHQSEWVDWMEDVFDRAPDIGICGLKRRDLKESPWERGQYKSVVKMLPHERGQRWLVVEEVKHVMGTCQAFSSMLLDKIGYLYHPSKYGFDDVLAAIRCREAGFRSVFLCGFEIDHIDPGGTTYSQWKRDEANRVMRAFLTMGVYCTRTGDVYYDGGFENSISTTPS